MPLVYLGNVAVREVIGADPDGTPIHRRYDGQSTTTITLPEDPDGWTPEERLAVVAHEDGHWRALSAQPPAWVESDDPDLAQVFAAHFGCPVGRPAGWVDRIEVAR